MIVALLLLVTQAPQGAESYSSSARYLRPEVSLEHIDGRPWYTVQAQNASAEEILKELAEVSGRELEGFP